MWGLEDADRRALGHPWWPKPLHRDNTGLELGEIRRKVGCVLGMRECAFRNGRGELKLSLGSVDGIGKNPMSTCDRQVRFGKLVK